MKAFHVAYTFDQPTAGVVTIPADTAEEAGAKVLEMLKDFNNVAIFETMDIEEIPAIKAAMDFHKHNLDQAQKASETTVLEGVSADSDEATTLSKIILN